MNLHIPARSWLILSFFFGLVALVTPAEAQLRTAEGAGYVLRANVASAANLPEEMREKYGLRAGAYLINVVVLKQGGIATQGAVDAEVVVETKDLIGNLSPIDMRRIEEHTGVSYIGTFAAPLNEFVLDFDIVARPAGSGSPIRLQFRERLPRPL